MNVTIELTEYVDDDKLIELRRLIRDAFDDANLDTNSITISCASAPTTLNALPDLRLHTIIRANLSEDMVGLRVQKDAELLLQCSLGAAAYEGINEVGQTVWRHPHEEKILVSEGGYILRAKGGTFTWLR
jgi:hypothetical protein